MVSEGGGRSACITASSGSRSPTGNNRPCRDVGGGEIVPGFAMLSGAKRASHIDPPASPYAIMRRACPYREENPGPGKDQVLDVALCSSNRRLIRKTNPWHPRLSERDARTNRSLRQRNRSLVGSRSKFLILKNRRAETRRGIHDLLPEFRKIPRQRSGSWPLTPGNVGTSLSSRNPQRETPMAG
jgi:hypothetical protein